MKLRDLLDQGILLVTVVYALRNMGIGGDAILHNGLSDLGDCRHSNLLRDSSGGDEVQLLEFEVLDSEDDDDGDDDPFRHVQIKRAATSVPREVSRRVIKRSRTDPGEIKNKKKPKDLLSVLLPDNVDSSVINDLSILQESTQMTSIVSNQETKDDTQLTDEDLKTVLEDPEAVDDKQSDGSSQDFVLEKIERYDAISKNWKEKTQEDTRESTSSQSENKDEHNVEGVPVTENLKELESEDNDLPVSKQEESSPPDAEITNESTVSNKEPHNSNTSENKEPEEHTAARPTKRKSTLAELCARKNTIPHRVGLSKRANINHLHSYLAKK